jgi:hypothetical protein
VVVHAIAVVGLQMLIQTNAVGLPLGANCKAIKTAIDDITADVSRQPFDRRSVLRSEAVK